MNIKKPLTFENVFKYVSDYDIFKYYCPGFIDVGQKFKSPFRKDKNASAVIYITLEGRLRFNDFVLPTLNSIQFVKELYSYKSITQALARVVLDFKIKEVFAVDWEEGRPSPSTTPVIYDKKITKPTKTIIKVRYRKWAKYDLDYWSNFGISLNTLAAFNVHPIDYFWINDDRIKAEKYSYSYNYYWDGDIYKRKIYQPFSKVAKWFGNGGRGVVQGEGMLPYAGDLLIITKSLKDVMTLHELGYTSIAPSTEKTMPSKKYLDKQKTRFDKIIIFLDNDDTGIKASQKHSEELNLPYILIPEHAQVKDISDYVNAYGDKKAKELLVKLLKNAQ